MNMLANFLERGRAGANSCAGKQTSYSMQAIEIWSGNETRTRDPDLGKVVCREVQVAELSVFSGNWREAKRGLLGSKWVDLGKLPSP
jgi:hypothetical protein